MIVDKIDSRPCWGSGAEIILHTPDMDAAKALMDKYIDGKTYVAEIKEKRARRSLDANAYYFQLARKCAEKMNISLTELHNRNLADLGIPWRNSDDEIHWMLQKDNDFWLKQKEIHLCPTDKTEVRNGVVYRWFFLLKPSHLFDTKEMSALIDYMVQDAKELGVETVSVNEIERLKSLWKNDGSQ